MSRPDTNRPTFHDRVTWARARTLQDVADRTAQWLEGKLGSQPNYQPNCGPDDETAQLIPTLARANRAGYLTTCSQPGHAATPGFDHALWRQRPAVDGFVHPGSLLDALVPVPAIAVWSSACSPDNSHGHCFVPASLSRNEKADRSLVSESESTATPSMTSVRKPLLPTSTRHTMSRWSTAVTTTETHCGTCWITSAQAPAGTTSTLLLTQRHEQR